MRFFKNGPSIPDLLLERRDAGRVVFFCGAGVSFNAGMPTFLGLTKEIVDYFDPPAESDIMKAFGPWLNADAVAAISLDQVFHLLQQEYGREEVNELVTQRLSSKVTNPSGPVEHGLISRISSDRDGNPQIVTTNFDLLFEDAILGYAGPVHVPPSLPELTLGMPISGITYLHGRLTQTTGHNYPYVLSSADFGRAYLAEGWATNFVRSLLSEYTVVLVGYQAEDPPIRYLLQGLNHDGRSDRSNLYAFDRGQSEEIEAKWRDRGVTPIAYSGHDVLWETLSAWADRSDDPRAWRRKIIGTTENDPKSLSPHNRGQVAHLIRTTPGAKQFSNAEPTAHPEWINVFDAGSRAAKPSKGYGVDAEIFVPLDVYGLDDDPPRPKEGGRQTKSIHENLIEWNRGDANPSDAHRLGGRQVTGQERMPSRLYQLINWIGKNLDSPVMAWWAARQNGLHPRLLEHVKTHMRRNKELHPKARSVWNIILEHQTDERFFARSDGWFDLKDRVEQEGWTPSVLRGFADATKPTMVCSRPYGVSESRPPQQNWDDVELSQITSVEVKFLDRQDEEIDIPDAALLEIITVLQNSLLQASGMLRELGVQYFQTPTCYPDREVSGTSRDRDFDAYIQWFVTLFERLTVFDTKAAAALAELWPVNDPYFFRNLKLFAMNQVGLFSIDQVFRCVSGLSDDEFWDDTNTRELLFLLADRWTDFSGEQKATIAKKIISGPPQPDHVNDEEFPALRSEFSARYGRWLIQHECIFPEEQANALDAIINTLPDWSEGRAALAVTERNGTFGWVGTDDNPDVVLDIPVNQIVERAKEDLERDFNSFTDKRPFTGLVKNNPRKALAALSVASKTGDYTTKFWTALVQEWPEDSPNRLFRVFMRRLAALPHKTVREMRYTLGDWLRDKLPVLLNQDRELAWVVFDHCISAWVSDDGVSTTSGMGQTRVGGEVINNSRRTYGHAINGPIGEATGGITRSISELKLNQAEGIPDEFKTRLERLLAAPGEGSDHCIAMLTHYLGWLHHIDPEWAGQRLFPLFAFEHPAAEPAWNGLLSSGEVPSPTILIELKELLKDLFPRIYSYGWDRDVAKSAALWLAWMAIFRRDADDGLTAKEARSALRRMTDTTRRDLISDLIFWLGRVGQKNEDGWNAFVIPFLTEIWPRERSFRTSSSVTSWISLLDDTGDDFPAVYSAVKKFLIPVEGESHWLYRFTRDVGGTECLTARYPAVVLDLMDTITPDATEYPPRELSQILEMIEEADETLIGDPRYNRLLDLVERA